jgi:hypothetical protein
MFFKQNLKANSAAVKQYRESLSPNKKAQVLVTHASEQQIYRQPLSLENKVQILCNDADAHRKQHESLPPEKKVNILETNADAHKKKRLATATVLPPPPFPIFILKYYSILNFNL